jgi:6-phosphogluconate dehydrogenase
MVHNGIEYGDMQLICEAYNLMKNVVGLSNSEIADVGLLLFLSDFIRYLGNGTKEN